MILFDKKIIFLHIPRNAGTSIKEVLKKNSTLFSDIPWHLRLNYYEDRYNININDYKVFTCVRNPYERLYSIFLYRKWKNKPKNISKFNFSEWISTITKNEALKAEFWIDNTSQCEWIGDNNIDIIRHENLENDFSKIAKKYNIKYNKLSHLHKTNKKNILTKNIKNKIYDMFENDFMRFEYV